MTTLQKAIHQCKLAGACDLLRIDMTPTELCQLLHTPEGVDFILKGIPTLSMWRYFGCEYREVMEQHHIYLDSGAIELGGDVQDVIVAGATHLRITPNQCKLYNITLVHGAKADVLATDWAVVSVEADNTSHAYIATTDHAISI